MADQGDGEGSGEDEPDEPDDASKEAEPEPVDAEGSDDPDGDVEGEGEGESDPDPETEGDDPASAEAAAPRRRTIRILDDDILSWMRQVNAPASGASSRWTAIRPLQGGEGETVNPDNLSRLLRRTLTEVAESAKDDEPKAGAREVDELTPIEQQELDDHKQDTKLKGRYANVLLGMLGVQMLGADAVFVLYAAIGPHWNLSTEVIDVWLGATVVQVVSVVTIVVRYLFPNRDSRDKGK